MNNPNQDYDPNGLLQENEPSCHIAQMSIHMTESVIRFACDRINRGE